MYTGVHRYVTWSEFDYLMNYHPKIENNNPDWTKCKLLGSLLGTEEDIDRRKSLAINSIKSLSNSWNDISNIYGAIISFISISFPSLLLEHVPSGQDREVLHFRYTTWPDFGVPESPSAFLHFLLAVRKSGALDPSVGPPIVHCSAGIGR